mgnify:CR=1 FL=1
MFAMLKLLEQIAGVIVLNVSKPLDTCNPTFSSLYSTLIIRNLSLLLSTASARLRTVLSYGVHLKSYHRAPPLVCCALLLLFFGMLITNRQDVLVRNFLVHINSQSYIFHPSSFLGEYCDWWANRQANNALSLQWTCLLLIVCACSAQHTHHQLRSRLEIETGEQLETLSDRYHRTTRELHGAIPIRYWDITNVQVLMLSSLWYKCEARFISSWHALNVAIRIAQERRK